MEPNELEMSETDISLAYSVNSLYGTGLWVVVVAHPGACWYTAVLTEADV